MIPLPDSGKARDHSVHHRQFARQSNEPSWQAVSSGDQRRTPELLEEDRKAGRTKVGNNRRQGLRIRRVRVVERPLSARARRPRSHRPWLLPGSAAGILAMGAVIRLAAAAAPPAERSPGRGAPRPLNACVRPVA
ncbi:DUF6879 family protein [Actinomadura sp. NPDC023710]|uniref:DUF6879 family protein n=1 Tax=Actinomadura sp. NPDC023710 TaxID=3158219 RepID=UPI0033EAF5E9